MRRVARRPLPLAAATELARLTTKVKTAAEPAKKAAELWQKKPKPTFDTIRDTLERMATGRGRCMYCEDSLGTDIEHFYPRARYPGRAFSWSNYLLACSHCNSNLKRSQFPFLRRRPALIGGPAGRSLLRPGVSEIVARREVATWVRA